jgi:hypothetical protein
MDQTATPVDASGSLQEKARELIQALYEGVLQRVGDEYGVAKWTESLVKGASTPEIIKAFINSEEFQLSHPPRGGGRNELWVPPGHFYSPIADRKEASKACARAEQQSRVQSIVGIDIDKETMLRTWGNLVPLMIDNPFPVKPTTGYRYAFDNPSYSYGDGSVLQAMIRYFSPKRIIEVGTGWSSACMVDTVERYCANECELIFIDPYPELSRRLVGDTKLNVQTFASGVQDIPLEVFDQLNQNDILFIDSTHVLRTGSDVCRELFEIFPRLSSGVLVHLHDMFWPFEYPRHWAVDENRSWNELYAVRAFLMYNKEWEIVMFNDFLAKFERQMIAATCPRFLENTGGALWLRRK